MTDDTTKEVLQRIIVYIAEIVKKYNEEAFNIFLSRLKEYEMQYFRYKNLSIEYFIEMACRERNIPSELSHRIVSDFIWFVIKCQEKIKDAWLWDFHKLFYMFWRFYQTLFNEVIKIEEVE